MSVTTTDGVGFLDGAAGSGAGLAPALTVAAKRALDVVVAVVALVVLAPVLAAVAVAVALGSPGPVLFTQRRVGRGGVPFAIVKFRTMVADAEARLAARPDLHGAYEANGCKLTPGADPRVTAVGRLLRRVDLDELPQLWNVVRGEMSLVGPRPVPEAELARYGPHRRAYESVRPGLTGPWQVSGRNRLDYHRRVALDREYAARLSLARDLAILARTLPAVVRGGGAGPEPRAPDPAGPPPPAPIPSMPTLRSPVTPEVHP